jgi:ferredoxin-type protein NapH
MNTYQHPVSSRRSPAWALSALLLTLYVFLYYTDVLEAPARRLHLSGKWTLYALVYTVAMLVGGAFFLWRHGPRSPYHRVRTASVLVAQVVFAFALPKYMTVFGHQEYYFTYFWPLKIEYLYPQVILQQPFLIVLYSALGSLVAFPLLAYFLGKRFYCSWICGCGGLANTAGEPFRHLSDKSNAAWRFEKVSIYSVFVLAIVSTIVVALNWAVGQRHPDFAHFAFFVQKWYGFVVGSFLAGVVGVGLYPLMGTRVWCRFACPMAAMLGLIQKFGRFRITVKKDMCISCGNCSTYCEMGIDVRQYAMANQDFKRASCVGCGMCAQVCPRGVLKLELRPDRAPGRKIRVFSVDV